MNIHDYHSKRKENLNNNIKEQKNKNNFNNDLNNNNNILIDNNSNIFFNNSNNFRCIKCRSIPFISLNSQNHKVNTNCYSGHENSENIKDYLDHCLKNEASQINQISCSKCRKIINLNLSSSNEKQTFFQYCKDCKNYLCQKCSNSHKYSNRYHKLLNIDTVDTICLTHGKTFNSFCNECKTNICQDCFKEKHKNHNVLDFEEIIIKGNDLEIIKEKLKKEKNNLDNIEKILRKLIIDIQSEINKIIDYKELEIKFKEKIINIYEKNKENYSNICNIKDLSFNINPFILDNKIDLIQQLKQIFAYLKVKNKKTLKKNKKSKQMEIIINNSNNHKSLTRNNSEIELLLNKQQFNNNKILYTSPRYENYFKKKIEDEDIVKKMGNQFDNLFDYNSVKKKINKTITDLYNTTTTNNKETKNDNYTIIESRNKDFFNNNRSFDYKKKYSPINNSYQFLNSIQEFTDNQKKKKKKKIEYSNIHNSKCKPNIYNNRRQLFNEIINSPDINQNQRKNEKIVFKKESTENSPQKNNSNQVNQLNSNSNPNLYSKKLISYKIRRSLDKNLGKTYIRDNHNEIHEKKYKMITIENKKKNIQKQIFDLSDKEEENDEISRTISLKNVNYNNLLYNTDYKNKNNFSLSKRETVFENNENDLGQKINKRSYMSLIQVSELLNNQESEKLAKKNKTEKEENTVNININNNNSKVSIFDYERKAFSRNLKRNKKKNCNNYINNTADEIKKIDENKNNKNYIVSNNYYYYIKSPINEYNKEEKENNNIITKEKKETKEKIYFKDIKKKHYHNKILIPGINKESKRDEEEEVEKEKEEEEIEEEEEEVEDSEEKQEKEKISKKKGIDKKKVYLKSQKKVFNKKKMKKIDIHENIKEKGKEKENNIQSERIKDDLMPIKVRIHKVKKIELNNVPLQNKIKKSNKSTDNPKQYKLFTIVSPTYKSPNNLITNSDKQIIQDKEKIKEQKQVNYREKSQDKKNKPKSKDEANPKDKDKSRSKERIIVKTQERSKEKNKRKSKEKSNEKKKEKKHIIIEKSMNPNIQIKKVQEIINYKRHKKILPKNSEKNIDTNLRNSLLQKRKKEIYRNPPNFESLNEDINSQPQANPYINNTQTVNNVENKIKKNPKIKIQTSKYCTIERNELLAKPIDKKRKVDTYFQALDDNDIEKDNNLQQNTKIKFQKYSYFTQRNSDEETDETPKKEMEIKKKSKLIESENLTNSNENPVTNTNQKKSTFNMIVTTAPKKFLSLKRKNTNSIDLSKKKIGFVIKEFENAVCSLMELNQNHFVVGFLYGEIDIYNIKQYESIISIEEHKGRISSLYILKDDNILSSSYDKTMKIIHINTKENNYIVYFTFNFHKSIIYKGIELSSSNSILSMAFGGEICIWEKFTVKSYIAAKQIQINDEELFDMIQVSETLLLVLTDTTLRYYEIDSYENICNIKGLKVVPHKNMFLVNKKFLGLLSINEITFFDIERKKLKCKLIIHNEGILENCSILKDNSLLFILSKNEENEKESVIIMKQYELKNNKLIILGQKEDRIKKESIDDYCRVTSFIELANGSFVIGTSGEQSNQLFGTISILNS